LTKEPEIEAVAWTEAQFKASWNNLIFLSKAPLFFVLKVSIQSSKLDDSSLC
jgi:hypothetical protein